MSIREGNDILNAFVETWKESFRPKTLYKNSKGKDRVHWSLSCYLSKWLFEKYHAWFEYPVSPEKNKTKLDAAVWFKEKGIRDDIDLAIEWEWGRGYKDPCNKKFTECDFVKLLTVRAKAGLAIVGTRCNGEKKKEQSETFLKNIRKSNAKNNPDNRPISIIEVRRVKADSKKYECFYHNLDKDNPIRPDKNPLVILEVNSEENRFTSRKGSQRNSVPSSRTAQGRQG